MVAVANPSTQKIRDRLATDRCASRNNCSSSRKRSLNVWQSFATKRRRIAIASPFTSLVPAKSSRERSMGGDVWIVSLSVTMEGGVWEHAWDERRVGFNLRGEGVLSGNAGRS